MRVALALFCTVMLPGCPDKSEQPPGDERLLAKLKAEKDREAKDGPLVAPRTVEPVTDAKVNPLAEFAAKGTQKRELSLPSKTLLSLGKASLRLNALAAMHTVGESPAITTDDWFLRVSFSATANEPTDVDLTGAHLELGDKSFAFARDAQAAFRHPGRVNATPNGDPLVVFFECTTDALKSGLTLVVPADANEARLELQ